MKAEILDRAFQVQTRAQNENVYRMRRPRGAASKQIKAAEPRPVAAIGVAPGVGREYKLAVRVFKGQERQGRDLLRGLERHEGELDVAHGVRYAPRVTLKAGGSIGHYRITAGTLGGFVEDDDAFYILSNNHVLANSNQCFGGDRILQPGPMDVTSKFKEVGRLARWYPLSRNDPAGVDAALATFTDAVDFFQPWTYAGIGSIQRKPVQDRFSITRVIKRGRTTGVTRGTISAYELDGVMLDYSETQDPALVAYDDQIEIVGDPPNKPFSQGGDSGSFIIDRDGLRVYALLYGGGPDDRGIDRTLAHFMPDVFGKMGVRLVQ
ncbi:MAG TPA: hypothetical protein VGC54_10325 [Planctomycetota bacterium]